MTVRIGDAAEAPDFASAANKALQNEQLRSNVRRATGVIRGKRARVVEEMPDWEQLREAGRQIKEHTLLHLDIYLRQFEDACTRAGGKVHWARDADEANRIIVGIIQACNEKEVIKVKTMTSDEIRLNPALEAAGITPYETDLADLIVQLGGDAPSHIVVPALHRNRMEIRELFLKKMGLSDLGDRPEDLTEAARLFLREKFLRVNVGISGANFAIAETGSVCVVESEGNGRMCVSLPQVLISLIGIEKLIPRFQDLEVFFQLLPRSATGERMNPYNSIWTGASPGDGPQEFHVVLLDNGRTTVLADAESRETLNCIRCGACLNICPVYRQTGGHAYGSIYSGPIGAILTPQLQSMQHSQSLPYASSLCGACYEVCPVKINIPEILIHLRRKLIESGSAPLTERIGMKAAGLALSNGSRLEMAEKFARLAQWPFEREGNLRNLPGILAGWTKYRDMPAVPKESFREWWAKREKLTGGQGHRLWTQDYEILAGIQRSLAAVPRSSTDDYAAIPRGYIQAGRLDPKAKLNLLEERLSNYSAKVYHSAELNLRETIAGAMNAAGRNHLLVTGDIRVEWLPSAPFKFSRDLDLTYEQLDRSEGVLTTCAIAIALTGTMVLRHSAQSGHRALTLIPDYHLCIVRAEHVVETVPEAIRAIDPLGESPLTTISGPSATSDIEMTRIKGVHGPRILNVIILER